MKLDRALTQAILPLAVLLWIGGCSKEDCIECLDTDPPAVPTGVFSVTGDGQVTVYWNDLDQSDLSGYGVYRDDNGDGTFEHLVDIRWDQNLDEGTGLHWYVDQDVINGDTYEYAVTSFDGSGNESNLSREVVLDTPRPEGFDVVLYDRTVNSAASGFDFWNSTLNTARRVDASDLTADVFVSWQDEVPFVRIARDDVLLQDYGNVMSGSGFVDLDLLSYAPRDGWSQLGRAELILGHAYVVRVGTAPNFAKFAVTALDLVAKSVTIDWAYQTDPGNRELKAAPSAVTQPHRGDRPAAEMISF